MREKASPSWARRYTRTTTRRRGHLPRRVRTDTAGSAGLFLRIHTDPRDLRGPLTEHAASVDPDNNIVTITGRRDWTSYEVTARVPEDANIVMFGMFLADRGRIELQHAELTRGT